MHFYTEMYFIKFWIFTNNLFGFFIIPICVEMKWFKGMACIVCFEFFWFSYVFRVVSKEASDMKWVDNILF